MPEAPRAAWHGKETIMIGVAFIRKWECRYCEGDEPKYRKLLGRFKTELRSGHVSFDTIMEAVKWKSERIKGLMKKSERSYCAAVQRAYKEKDEKTKLGVLIQLDGWAVPMASTVLHFLFPDRFPIIDRRTLSTLDKVNHFRASRTPTGYWRYCAEIRKISKETGLPLRAIDRALFAYDKAHPRR